MSSLKAAALTMLVVAAPAYAAEETPYAGAAFSYEISDNSRDSDDGLGFQLHAGLPIGYGRNNAVELSFFDLSRDRDVDGQEDYATGLFVDWVHRYDGRTLPRLGEVTPFMLAGVGLIREDVRGDEHFHPGGNIGAGALIPLPWHRLALRTEARAQVQQNDRSVSDENFLIDYRINVGLQIPLPSLFPVAGGSVAPAQDCAVAVVDPVTGRADCGSDSDRDGVQDSLDECPGTAAGQRVMGNGCPSRTGGGPDGDADGVADGDDRCPETKGGMRVDAEGCVVGQTMVLQGVRFVSNSAQLTEDSRRVLSAVARTLNTQKNLRVEIAGHTDSIGTEAFNLLLSQQRAESVRQFLISHGVAPERLTAQGYGEFRPVASNDSEAGREQNRRVEFKLIVE